MKNAIKKAISVLLVAVMVFGAAPLAGFVGLNLPEFNLFTPKAEAATSGTCGDNLTWSFKSGTLTISGTGEMKNWDSSADTPWWTFAEEIKKIIFKDGVTVITSVSFHMCLNVETVFLPSTLTEIQMISFMSCDNIKTTYFSGTEDRWNQVLIGSNNGTIAKNVICNVNGYCGETLFWHFDELTGALTISGTGDMYDWSSSLHAPWYSYNSSIKSVTIGNGATSIGDYAFYHCGSVTDVTIPNSVTSIGDSAFSNCKNLANITIPENVTSIGDYAFYECYALENITIPENVTSIGDRAFYECDSLVSVTIPKSVTSLGVSVFGWCRSLASITVDPANTVYSSDVYGVLFNKDKTVLVQYPSGNARTGYTVPDSVTSIGDYAFYLCYNLESVTISVSVKNIGYESFYCHKIKDVYYVGTQADWNRISIGEFNRPLLDANIHFNHTHALDTVKENSDPTCAEIGYKTVICVCGYSITDIIPALNHKDTLVKVDAKAPTCTEIGWDAYEYCTACDYTTYVEKEALDHDIIIDKAVEATCTETGLTIGQHCSRCDDMTVEQETVPTLNHKDTLVKVDAKAPTCTEIGWDAYEYCTACTYTTYEEKSALDHDIVIDKAIDATCTETGLTEGQHCSRCDDMTVAQEIVPTLNHKDTLVKVDAKAPICTGIGWDAYEYCTACDYTTYEEKGALEHDIVINEAVESTCTETGLTEGQHCSRCDDMTVEQEIIPVKLHNHTAKYDSTKHWKECSCGSIIDEQNHSFVGGNTCSCGFKRVVNSSIKIKNNSGSKTINYGETLKLTAIVTSKPANAKIYWYIDGEKKSEGEVFNVKFESGTKIITAKLVDENGVVYQNASGDEIIDSENVTVKAGFFQKLISFFKNLFGMNRTIVQAFKGIY